MVDDFEGTAPSGVWTLQGDTPTISVSGGQLHITPDPQDPSWAGMVSGAYDFDECAVWVRVPVVYSNATTGFTFFQLVGDSNVQFEARDGNLEMKHMGSEVDVPYDAMAHQWWRMREQGSTLFFETSPDGLAWTTHHSVTTPSDIGSMKLGIGLVPGSGPSGPLETQFDDLNGAP